jgi:hypothetical protein
MTYSFSNLKKSKGSLDKLSKAIENLSEKNSGNDDRFWYPETDKAGNGSAIIRFLPASAVDGEEGLPWVRTFSHGFQGPGGWLIENCLTTLNEKCPVCENNSVLWNSGLEANKEIVRKRKRKLTYISNILVISDPKNPDNEGKVFLFKFGKKIFDKITEAMNPEFEDETAINPFDFWEGANFKIKIRQVEGYRNYDRSEFDSPTALYDGDDDKLESLWKKEHSLKEFVKPSQFKTYDKIKERLNAVLGERGELPQREEDVIPESHKVKKTKSIEDIDDGSITLSFKEDSDSDLDYFKDLAEED